MYITDNNI